MSTITELSRKLIPTTAIPTTAAWTPKAFAMVSFSNVDPVAPIPSTAKSKAVSRAMS
jgi:hypothetical protein